MDSKIKERIIGAAVLVALGVWLIPWVLNGSDPATDDPEPVAATEVLPAESAVAPVRTETVELDPAPAAVRIAEPEPARAAPTAIAADPTPDPLEPVAVAPAAAEPDTSPAPVPAATVAARDVVAPDPGGWSVQLGSFGEPANARQLASRVAEYGYQARVSDFRSDGRTMHRVRVSGFETRDAAEAAASSLSAHGFVPRVFPPAE